MSEPQPMSAPQWAVVNKLDPSKIAPGTDIQICASNGASLNEGKFVRMEGTVLVFTPEVGGAQTVGVGSRLDVRQPSTEERRRDLGSGPDAEILVDYRQLSAYRKQISSSHRPQFPDRHRLY